MPLFDRTSVPPTSRTTPSNAMDEPSRLASYSSVMKIPGSPGSVASKSWLPCVNTPRVETVEPVMETVSKRLPASPIRPANSAVPPRDDLDEGVNEESLDGNQVPRPRGEERIARVEAVETPRPRGEALPGPPRSGSSRCRNRTEPRPGRA